ncbi:MULTISPECIES: hypothetical protein [unclassified Burkholderia]|uniref:hypothetical protein n=1 Tax=unclassified Burkholderia TaxID=2613784 RepID=UPI00141E634F|nr:MULTISPECIES: hypothetical protein [unclassified Burkholderia]NIE81831.1 hypothetical protein [Burkholderia sp. Tr-860]NIF64832.1 hypothetical protein [Burkholderia sp. Cy-647]NIF93922.1 hypothetical protein [Burkholderia sp. Ax-1720]
MNIVQRFLSEIPVADLRLSVEEMKNYEETGVLVDGVVRRLSADLMRQTGMTHGDSSKVIEAGVLRLAAYRWANV